MHSILWDAITFPCLWYLLLAPKSYMFLRFSVCIKLCVSGHFLSISPISSANSPHKGPITREMFPFDDVIMDVTNNPNKNMQGIICVCSTNSRLKYPNVISSFVCPRFTGMDMCTWQQTRISLWFDFVTVWYIAMKVLEKSLTRVSCKVCKNVTGIHQIQPK